MNVNSSTSCISGTAVVIVAVKAAGVSSGGGVIGHDSNMIRSGRERERERERERARETERERQTHRDGRVVGSRSDGGGREERKSVG